MGLMVAFPLSSLDAVDGMLHCSCMKPSAWSRQAPHQQWVQQSSRSYPDLFLGAAHCGASRADAGKCQVSNFLRACSSPVLQEFAAK